MDISLEISFFALTVMKEDARKVKCIKDFLPTDPNPKTSLVLTQTKS